MYVRRVLVFNLIGSEIILYWIGSKITPYQFNETVQRKTRIATAESTILGQRMCKMILLGCGHSVLILTLSLLLCSEPTAAIPWQEDLTAQLQQIQHQCTYNNPDNSQNDRGLCQGKYFGLLLLEELDLDKSYGASEQFRRFIERLKKTENKH